MKKLLLIFILFLTSCSTTKNQNQAKETSSDMLIDLVDSTRIIRTLISQNKLTDVLEEHDPDQLDLLLNNFSPAHMAFQSEVIDTTIPYVVVYYFQNSPQEQIFIKKLSLLAEKYKDRIKFVLVDVDKLFILAQDAEIEKPPALFFVKGGEVMEKLFDNITMDLLSQKIDNLLSLSLLPE